MKRKGQSFLEYSLLIGCIVVTLFAMQAYLKRGIQGIVKSTSDDLGSPVLEFTNNDAQIEGALSRGLDPQFHPATITADQEILTNEYASGDRRFTILQDSRTTDSSMTVTIPPAEYLNYGRTFNNNVPTGQTAKPPKQ